MQSHKAMGHHGVTGPSWGSHKWCAIVDSIKREVKLSEMDWKGK